MKEKIQKICEEICKRDVTDEATSDHREDS